MRHGVVLTAPNLGTKAWQSFPLVRTLSQHLGKPARMLNDATVQGLGVIAGTGVEVVVTLGTGMGFALFDDGRPAPQMEMAHHPLRRLDNVLLTPHHGSKSSSTPQFVEAVKPQIAIHAAGWRSHYRHPGPEIVERYAETGADQYTTGVGGAIRVWRDPVSGQLRVEAWRENAARWWNAAPEP